MKFLFLSWQQFHQVCFQTAKKIISQNLKIERLVAISRGGLVSSRLFSDYLNLPISPFTIISYTSFGKHYKPKIVEDLKVDIKGEKILLVDEVADSGETFLVALNYLRKFKPAKIWTTAPFIKNKSKYRPDFWQQKTDKWIIFPYDVRETIKELKGKMSKEELIKSGLDSKQVRYFSQFKRKKGGK